MAAAPPSSASSSALGTASSSLTSSRRLPTFVMDISLLRYAKHLRLLGYDVLCREHVKHDDILMMSIVEQRYVLTASPKMWDQLQSMLSRRAARASSRAVEKAGERQPPHHSTIPAASPEYRRPGYVVVGYDSDGNTEYATDDDGDGDRTAAAGGGRHRGLTSRSGSSSGHRGRPLSRSQESRRQADPNHHDDNDVDSNSDAEEEDEGCPPGAFLINTKVPFKSEITRVMAATGATYDPSIVFTRCGQCNELISDVSKESVRGDVHETVYRVYERFYRCAVCRKVYWGMDEGVVVNYKALRTAEYLERLNQSALEASGNHATAALSHLGRGCLISRGGTSISERLQPHDELAANSSLLPPLVRRTFLAYPRRVKCLVLTFLDPKVDDVMLLAAFPGLHDLVKIVRDGGSWAFKREKRKVVQ